MQEKQVKSEVKVWLESQQSLLYRPRAATLGHSRIVKQLQIAADNRVTEVVLVGVARDRTVVGTHVRL